MRQHWLLARVARSTNATHILCTLLAPEEVMHVQNTERIRTHQCTHQKTTKNTQGALERRHINAEYVYFVSRL